MNEVRSISLQLHNYIIIYSGNQTIQASLSYCAYIIILYPPVCNIAITYRWLSPCVMSVDTSTSENPFTRSFFMAAITHWNILHLLSLRVTTCMWGYHSSFRRTSVRQPCLVFKHRKEKWQVSFKNSSTILMWNKDLIYNYISWLFL